MLIAVWNEAGEFMRKHLASYTLAEVAEMARGQAPWPDADVRRRPHPIDGARRVSRGRRQQRPSGRRAARW